jgi:hypothetical protein
MKPFLIITILAVASLGFTACQNGQHQRSDDFAQKTHRAYNPQTGSFEQSPPFGKQSNKSDAQQ